MEKLERIKDDNTKYHYVMREINRPKQKIQILVKDEEGNVPGSTTEKIKIIEDYFKKTLAPLNMKDEFLSTPPCPMSKKFAEEEIQSMTKILGNDRLQAEFTKYAPTTTHKDINHNFQHYRRNR